MPHPRASILLGVLAAMLLPIRANGTIMKDMSLAELVTDADDIVVGTVLSVSSQWGKDHRNIYTSIQIQVAETWKGAPAKDGIIRLVQLGGSVGDLEMSVQGMPEFAPGERSVLFLRGSARRHVVGMSLGKRPLQFDAASKQWMVRPAARKGILRLQARGGGSPDDDRPVALSALRDQVWKLMGR
jgi:hypothetical protein